MLRPDVQAGIEGLGDKFSHGGNKIELRIRSIFEENLIRARYRILDEDMRPGFNGLFIDRQGQFICKRMGADDNLLSRF